MSEAAHRQELEPTPPGAGALADVGATAKRADAERSDAERGAEVEDAGAERGDAERARVDGVLARVAAADDDAPLDDHRVLHLLKADRRRALLRRALLGALALFLAGLAFRYRLPLASYLRGEIDLHGAPRYAPPHPVDEDALAAIDWHDVHGRLLPLWVITKSTRRLPEDERRAREHEAYSELRYALADDPNLLGLFDELEAALREDPIGRARRVDYLLWAYNDYLDAHAIPWRLEATLHLRRRGRPTFLTRSYEVLHDLRAPAGHRLRLLRRADLTNVDEGFLGHTTGGGDGALVMLDQVLEFGVRHVWPMLHGGLDARLPERERGLAPFVRREALGALEAPAYTLLHETAVDQQALIEVASSIHARASCGNTFRIYGLPWNGLEPPDQRALVEALDRSQSGECPEVTLGEAARLLGASERLGRTPALADAVEGLTTWVAGAVSVHELQHVADEGEGAQCSGCPEGMSAAAVDELSAYLASFASETHGYTALLQACSMEPDGEDVSEAPHAQALAIAFDAVLAQGCAGPIPDDLQRRARAARARLFGQADPPALPDDYPRRVTLLRR
ncbi:MAG: hypothetical protein CMN31_02460 [Sandaracinus sp.]|nr:hypothetical protein [Sandaracinus sp.]